MNTEKLERFRALVEKDMIEDLKNRVGITSTEVLGRVKAIVKIGVKYARVDSEQSGRFMVDDDENIYGIKAYGVIHRGKRYGTLDTINEWNWGPYYPVKKPKYTIDQIADELQATATNRGYYGNALRVAKDLPGMTPDEIAVLEMWLRGIPSAKSEDAGFRLQDIAIKLRKTITSE